MRIPIRCSTAFGRAMRWQGASSSFRLPPANARIPNLPPGCSFSCSRRRRSNRRCSSWRSGRTASCMYWLTPTSPAGRLPVIGPRPTANTSPTASPRAAARRRRSMSQALRTTKFFPMRFPMPVAALRRRVFSGTVMARGFSTCACRIAASNPSSMRCFITTRLVNRPMRTSLPSARGCRRLPNTPSRVPPTAKTPPYWCITVTVTPITHICASPRDGYRCWGQKRTCAPQAA